MYSDKTGTDAYQRYPLEPYLFSLANISYNERQNSQSWRHLGFVPSLVHTKYSLVRLQSYHDCMLCILEELKYHQHRPPTVYVWIDGKWFKRIAYIPIMAVLGDQLAQDTHCGRMKQNSGGAGRIHRNCMCLYSNADNPHVSCESVDMSLIDFLSCKETL